MTALLCDYGRTLENLSMSWYSDVLPRTAEHGFTGHGRPVEAGHGKTKPLFQTYLDFLMFAHRNEAELSWYNLSFTKLCAIFSKKLSKSCAFFLDTGFIFM